MSKRTLADILKQAMDQRQRAKDDPSVLVADVHSFELTERGVLMDYRASDETYLFVRGDGLVLPVERFRVRLVDGYVMSERI